MMAKDKKMFMLRVILIYLIAYIALPCADMLYHVDNGAPDGHIYGKSDFFLMNASSRAARRCGAARLGWLRGACCNFNKICADAAAFIDYGLCIHSVAIISFLEKLIKSPPFHFE